MKKRRILTLLITLCLIVACIPTFASEAAIKKGWESRKNWAISLDGTRLYYTNWYYLRLNKYGTSYEYAHNEWLKIGGKWYYFTDLDDQYGYSAYGRMANNEWINGYWFNKNGTWTYKYRGSWKKTSSGWQYKDTSGWKATGWQRIDGYWYYFNKSGIMQTGWKQIGKTWYYLKSNGQMAQQEEVTIKGVTYYFFGDNSYYVKK